MIKLSGSLKYFGWANDKVSGCRSILALHVSQLEWSIRDEVPRIKGS